MKDKNWVIKKGNSFGVLSFHTRCFKKALSENQKTFTVSTWGIKFVKNKKEATHFYSKQDAKRVMMCYLDGDIDGVMAINIRNK